MSYRWIHFVPYVIHHIFPYPCRDSCMDAWIKKLKDDRWEASYGLMLDLCHHHLAGRTQYESYVRRQKLDIFAAIALPYGLGPHGHHDATLWGFWNIKEIPWKTYKRLIVILFCHLHLFLETFSLSTCLIFCNIWIFSWTFLSRIWCFH